jgi:Transposase DDE domain
LPSSSFVLGQLLARRAAIDILSRQINEILRVRRETVEHPFGTLKMRMGATHFLMKRLPKVATEMALHVLAYNLTRVMNILGVKPLIAAIQT